jgi:predicted XRE-type DNA-binding protein
VLAEALHRDGLSMQRIGGLFGVTRQRVSHLLQRETSN